MTTTASRTSTDEIPTEVVDRIVLAVASAAEQARRSATVTEATRRQRILRLNRQARFNTALGLR